MHANVCVVNARAESTPQPVLHRCCALQAVHDVKRRQISDTKQSNPLPPHTHTAPQADSTFALDWDDVEGNSKRRLAGLKLEAQRTAESRRLKQQMKARGETPAGMGKPKGKKH